MLENAFIKRYYFFIIKEKFSIELQSNLGLRSQDEVVDRYFNKLSNQVVESEFNESIIMLKELLNIKLENIYRNSFPSLLSVFWWFVMSYLTNSLKFFFL